MSIYTTLSVICGVKVLDIQERTITSHLSYASKLESLLLGLEMLSSTNLSLFLDKRVIFHVPTPCMIVGFIERETKTSPKFSPGC